jgi:hypothetical protein
MMTKSDKKRKRMKEERGDGWSRDRERGNRENQREMRKLLSLDGERKRIHSESDYYCVHHYSHNLPISRMGRTSHPILCKFKNYSGGNIFVSWGENDWELLPPFLFPLLIKVFDDNYRF